jgi:histidinol-phosphate aminotransferase
VSPFPRDDYRELRRYDPERSPVRIDLSDNTNLWGTHPAALDRIRAASNDDLARYPELYADELRDAVSMRFGVDPECVTTGAGSDDVLDSAYRAVYAPGAKVSYAAPTFSMVEPFARMNGMTSRPVAWPEALDNPEALLAEAPDLVYVCRPNNPTGSLAPLDWVERLLELRGDSGPLVVVDEAYADFAGETLLPRAPEFPKLLIARTTSKAYGLAGLRCGFAVGSPEVALEIEKSRGPYKVSRLAAAAAAVAVRDEERWMEGVVRVCVANRARLHDELVARGMRPMPSHANFILFRAPTGDAKADAATLRGAGIGVRPFTDIPGIEQGLRVTVGPWESLEAFLIALDDAFSTSGRGGGS